MWNSIEKAWQVAFEQGWQSFKMGSIPIGAVITDKDGNIISCGHNRVNENKSIIPNTNILHAEMNAIINLDILKYPDVYSYILYACAEPCPMCMGTFVMSNLRTLRVAAKDSYAGSTHYCEDIPYIASKKIKVVFESGILEIVQIVMGTYSHLQRGNGVQNEILNKFERDNSVAFQIAKSLFSEKRLEFHVENNTHFSEIFNEIVSRIE